METFYAGGRVASAAVSILKSIAAAAVAMTLTTSAFANLVVNGGFETGNLTGWVELGNSSFTGVTCPGPGPTVFEGDCSAFSGPQGSPGREGRRRNRWCPWPLRASDRSPHPRSRKISLRRTFCPAISPRTWNGQAAREFLQRWVSSWSAKW